MAKSHLKASEDAEKWISFRVRKRKARVDLVLLPRTYHDQEYTKSMFQSLQIEHLLYRTHLHLSSDFRL